LLTAKWPVITLEHNAYKTNFLQQRNKMEKRLDYIRLKADYTGKLNCIIKI